MNIGSILYDNINNKKLGVLVYILNNNLILFKLENDLYPIFSKIAYESLDNIQTIGNINETENQNLKLQLLKYYRNHNLTNKEKQLLNKLMNYAYPNGIPEYNTTTTNTDEELESLNILQFLKKGNKCNLNTTHDSPFENLNEKKVYITNINEKGIWIGYEDLSSIRFNFLPFKNKELPKFYGISKLIPIRTNEIDSIYTKIEDEFNRRQTNNMLFNTINYNNKELKITEDGIIIKPSELSNNSFDFSSNTLKNKPIKVKTFKTNELEQELKTDLGADNPEILFFGGYNESNDVLLNAESTNVDKTLDLNDDLKEELNDLDNVYIKDLNNDDDINNSINDNEVNNNDLEIIEDEEIEILETVEKIQQKPVPELEKVYDNSIQINHIKKYKIEKIPRNIRNNNYLLNKYTNEIEKDVNIITFLKAITTNNDNTVKYTKKEFKPLVEEYSHFDFQNNYLIPLVITNKRIHLTDSDKVRHYNSAVIEDNMLGIYANITNEKLINKKRVVDYKAELRKYLNDIEPYPLYEDNIGILATFGDGKSKIYNNYLESLLNKNIKDELKLESRANRVKLQKIFQDTDVIRYGEYKNLEFTNYGGSWEDEINKLNLEHIKLNGPLCFFSGNEEIDLLAYENKIDKNVANSANNYDIVYNGNKTRIVGFLRVPLAKIINNYHINRDDLLDKDYLETVYLDENEDFVGMDHFDKFTFYLFSKKPKEILKDEYISGLNRIIPSIYDIINFYDEKGNKENNKIKWFSKSNIIKLIHKLNYFISDEYIENINNGYTDRYSKITYDDYLNLKKIFNDEIDTYEKINETLEKLKHNNKTKSKNIKHKLITEDIIENCNKVYQNQFTDYKNKEDNDIINYYKKEVDNGYYFILLLQKKYIESIDDNKDKLEITLNALKSHYDNLMGSPDSSSKICNSIRKPNIMIYKSLESLYDDNGKILTNSKGQIVKEGDYAFVELEDNKHLFRRSKMANGDYWIEEPISNLDKLLDNKSKECKNVNEDLMNVDEDKLNCTFNIENLECMNYEPDKMEKIQNLEEEIKELVGKIEYLESINSLKPNLDSEISKQESKIRFINDNYREYIKLEKERLIRHKEELKIENKCIHNKAIKSIHKLANLTDDEKYTYYNEIINQFQDINWTSKLNLEVVELEETDLNYLKCNVCDNRLLCKHYLYIINQLTELNEIDYEKLEGIYGEDINGSIYCRICGVWLFNTDVKDDVSYNKSSGKAVINREINEEQQKDLIEKNKKYLEKLISQTIYQAEDNKKDIEIRLKIYNLFKKLSGIKTLKIDDEIIMINFIKSFDYTPKNSYLSLLKLKFSGKGISNSVIEKFADKMYKQSYAIDLAGLFIIILQCGNYTVRNRYAGTEIMGYPLIDNGGLDGINYIARLIVQIAEVFDFMDEWKTDTTNKSVEKIVEKIVSAMKKRLLTHEIINTKLEEGLNKEYDKINYQLERDIKPSNYWTTFKPIIGVINWSLDKKLMDDNISNLKNSKYSMIKEIIKNSIHYSTSNIISVIYDYIFNKTEPLNYINLRTKLLNSSMAIKYDKLENDKKVNYYYKINLETSGIDASLKNINNNDKKLFDINKLNELSRIKINTTKSFELNKINIGNGKLSLSDDELKFINNKYITSGEHKGERHIYNKYDICIVNNEIKGEGVLINELEFPNLLRSIQEKNMFIKQNKKYSKIVEEIIKLLDHIGIKKSDNVIINIMNDDKFMIDLYNLCRQYIMINKLKKENLVIKNLDFEIKQSEIIIIHSIKKLIGVKTETNVDTLKSLFKIISNLNTLVQNNISQLASKLTNKTEIQHAVEQTLINIGNFNNVIDDYKNELINRGKIIDFVFPVNIDKLVENYNHYIIILFVDRMFNNLQSLVNMIIYNNWISEDKIVQYHFKSFYRYGNYSKLFKKWQNKLINIRNIYNILDSIIENNNCFNYEYNKLIKIYLFVKFFLLILNNKSDDQETTKQKNNKEVFSFYASLDTSLDDKEPADKPDYEEKNKITETEQDLSAVEQAAGEMFNFVKNIETKKESNDNITHDFILDFINYIENNNKLYNDMNRENIIKIKEETKQKQTRMNLDAITALKKTDGYDTDYNLIMKRLKMGSIDYSNLYDAVKENVGEDIVDDYIAQGEYSDAYDMGDKNYNDMDAEEINELAVVEAEDMDDDGDVGYGNMIID